MDIKARVFSGALFILFLVFLLYIYHRWSKRITEHRVNVILNNHQNSRLVFDTTSVPCGEMDPSAGPTSLECTVCLSEFQLGERIRLLPNCNHCFHIDCIDMWFCTHDTCPICRSHVDKMDLGSSATWTTTLLRRILKSATVVPAAREGTQQPSLA